MRMEWRRRRKKERKKGGRKGSSGRNDWGGGAAYFRTFAQLIFFTEVIDSLSLLCKLLRNMSDSK